jgi:hypothetical protein
MHSKTLPVKTRILPENGKQIEFVRAGAGAFDIAPQQGN